MFLGSYCLFIFNGYGMVSIGIIDVYWRDRKEKGEEEGMYLGLDLEEDFMESVVWKGWYVVVCLFDLDVML